MSAAVGTGTDDLLGGARCAPRRVPRAVAKPTAPRACTSTARSRCRHGHGGDGDAVVGARCAAGERCGRCPAAGGPGCAGSRCTTSPSERAPAGQRVALELAGVDWRDVGRGDVVCGEDSEIAPTYRVDVLLDRPPAQVGLRHGERVHVHHGTREAPARVVPLWQQADEDALAQLASTHRWRGAATPWSCGARPVSRRWAAPVSSIPARLVMAPTPRFALDSGGSRREATPRAMGGPPKRVPRSEAAHRPSDQEPPPLDAAALKLAALLRADGERPRGRRGPGRGGGMSPARRSKG